MAGLFTPAAFASWGSFSNEEISFRWPGQVPFSMTAAGISGAIPASSSPRQILGRLLTLIRNTRVPPVRRRASKSMCSSAPARAWPVMMWTEEQKSRWVTGMPA